MQVANKFFRFEPHVLYIVSWLNKDTVVKIYLKCIYQNQALKTIDIFRIYSLNHFFNPCLISIKDKS